jgi:hypothetical protein
MELTHAVCAVCGTRARSGGLQSDGRYLLKPCGHVAEVNVRQSPDTGQEDE